jgi:hypothetical protein
MNDFLSTAAALSLPIAAVAIPEQSAGILWLVGLVAVAAGANQVIEIWQKISGKNSQRQVSMEEAPQTKQACEKLHSRLDVELGDIRRAIQDGFAKMTEKDETRASGLHKRIDPIANEVAAVSRDLREHKEDHRAGRNAHAN